MPRYTQKPGPAENLAVGSGRNTVAETALDVLSSAFTVENLDTENHQPHDHNFLPPASVFPFPVNNFNSAIDTPFINVSDNFGRRQVSAIKISSRSPLLSTFHA